MPEPSILDARLAEIDRRLRSIQSGLQTRTGAGEPATSVPQPALTVLRPAGEPTPEPEASSTPPPAGEDAATLLDQLRVLRGAHERLLELHHELLAQYADALARAIDPPVAPAVRVSAGPFADFEAVGEFERTLQTLPRVTAVSVREYAAEDRVTFDVQVDDAGRSL